MIPVLNFRPVALAILLCVTATPTPAFSQDATKDILVEGETLLAAGRSDDAYSLLSAQEAELAGNPYFDYLLGVAALDSGRHSDAIFSLRRALMVAPEYSGARMELARAYFESGNAAMARPLFARLLGESPPPGVRRVINDYIASIDATPTAPKSSTRYSFDVAGGYDNNANGSTDNEQFLGFTLSPDNLKTESPFFEAGANFAWNNPRSTQFGWYAGGRASYRHNPDANFVDSSLVSGNAGMNWQRGSFFGRAGLDAYWATRDGDPNQSYAGLDTLFGSRVSDKWDITFGLRGGSIRHDDAIETLDVDRILYRAGLSYRFGTPGVVGMEIVGGDDSARLASSPYGNSKFGGRLTLYIPVGNNGQLFASTGSLTSDYDGIFFGSIRKDTQVSSLVQITFQDVWSEGLSLTPRIRYVDNDSNIALYDYDRTEVGLQLRWTPQ